MVLFYPDKHVEFFPGETRLLAGEDSEKTWGQRSKKEKMLVRGVGRGQGLLPWWWAKRLGFGEKKKRKVHFVLFLRTISQERVWSCWGHLLQKNSFGKLFAESHIFILVNKWGKSEVLVQSQQWWRWHCLKPPSAGMQRAGCPQPGVGKRSMAASWKCT